MATSRRPTGTRTSVALPGPKSLTASGTCTCSRPEQPDLDWSNPVVGEAFQSILRFWLDKGVDGFRIDVAHGMAKKLTEPFPALGAKSVDKQLRYEVVDHPLWDRDEVHDIFRVWRRILDEYSPPRIGVAEAWVMPGRRARYVRPDELHQAFNFDFLQAPWECAALVDVIEASLREAGGVGATATWVLSNHDVVRHLSRYCVAGCTPTFGQVVVERRHRARARPALRGFAGRARRPCLMLALPGSAYLYQGEELGAARGRRHRTDLSAGPDVGAFRTITTRAATAAECRCRGSRRGPSFGFSSVTGWIPQPADWAELSWGAEDGDPTSTLELYRSALALRRKFGTDDALTWLTRGPATLSFARSNGLVCIVNFGADAVAMPRGSAVTDERRARRRRSAAHRYRGLGSYELENAAAVARRVWPSARSRLNLMTTSRPDADELAFGRILVVDDDPTVSDVVARYLRREGYEVTLVGDGLAALESAAADSPDLVVLDIMLPGLDGLAVCRTLRERSPVPVILLTALGTETDRIMGLEVGADDYVTKPFSPRELVLRVASVLRRARTPAPLRGCRPHRRLSTVRCTSTSPRTRSSTAARH